MQISLLWTALCMLQWPLPNTGLFVVVHVTPSAERMQVSVLAGPVSTAFVNVQNWPDIHCRLVE